MKNKIIISIGSFTVGDVHHLLKTNKLCYIEAYEPRPDIYEEYVKIAKLYPGRFIPVDKAVCNYTGKALLKGKKTRSTICFVQRNFSNKSFEVEVISISSILERFDEIDELHLNCEGAEIPMIQCTDLSLFKKCKYILVQFHDFVPSFCITKQDVKICVNKLRLGFESKIIHRKYTTYEFRRK